HKIEYAIYFAPEENMEKLTNKANIRIGTVNGTGSQSSNTIIIKSLFRMGIPVSGKNLFPSNIFGLPTWFQIRANESGYTSFSDDVDIVVAMNKDSISQDVDSLKAGGLFIYNSDLRFDEILLNDEHVQFAVPFKELVKDVTDSIKLRKLLTNMVYVGVLAQITGMDKEVIFSVVEDFFKSKKSVVEINQQAIEVGFKYAEENFSKEFYIQFEKKNAIANTVLIDGNTAGALGAVWGGCGFASWYPITPSSSLMEEFENYANQFLLDENGKKNFAVVQAEDELSSIGMVIGASWAGARAMTATSGPGMSLMSEFVGLSYFAEVPSVIWDIQRTGPSTGLPTRTQQGDLRIAHTMGHGDGKHPVLLPSSPEECFYFGKLALDVAEQMQSFVAVLSDLDIGMNLWMTQDLSSIDLGPIHRGKVLSADDLKNMDSFARYKDVDGDGVPYRTLPGTHDDKAAFFTRGTGHDETSKYTESSEKYEDLMLRLKRKEKQSLEFLPKPIIKKTENNTGLGIIAYGSTDQAVDETLSILAKKACFADYLRVRALPFHQEVGVFLAEHDEIVVIDQNRDAQMKEFLINEYPQFAGKIKSVLSFDGLPVRAKQIAEKISEVL
ncbi:MAG: 2-oxoacid:acceptor oxidoreductase subunit alpha, partial [Bdellovibrionota bacterium]